jgi:cobalt-zinc-cadmium efflux system protein
MQHLHEESKSDSQHSDNHGHGHGHGDLSELRALSRKRLLLVFGLTGSFMIVEFVVGLMTNSLAILADAGHMLGDVAAIALALIASWFATRPVTEGKTYGYYRSEILASTINGLAMLFISGYILFEAYGRFTHPEGVPGWPMITIGLTGGLVNLLSMKVLKEDAQKSLNSKAAYLEVLADFLASAGVVLAGIIIQTTGFQMADPIVSALIAVALVPRTLGLLNQCVNILMEGTPDHIAMNDLRDAISAVPGVVEAHDLHVWTITSGMDAMSGHVLIDGSVADSSGILDKISKICEDRFGIKHSTVQIELVTCDRQKCG